MSSPVAAAPAPAVPAAAPAAAAAAAPAGWFLAGSQPADYVTGTDTQTFHAGKGSAFLAASAAGAKGFGTLMEQFTPQEYLGKRVRLTAWVKSDKVGGWAGVWMRVDGPAGQMLSFDNMQGRPIQGTTDWRQYDVVLDVPQEAIGLAFGVLLSGPGRVWMDDVAFAAVDPSVPTTDRPGTSQPVAPVNLDFEK
jgi:hypothetical protein